MPIRSLPPSDSQSDYDVPAACRLKSSGQDSQSRIDFIEEDYDVPKSSSQVHFEEEEYDIPRPSHNSVVDDVSSSVFSTVFVHLKK